MTQTKELQKLFIIINADSKPASKKIVIQGTSNRLISIADRYFRDIATTRTFTEAGNRPVTNCTDG